MQEIEGFIAAVFSIVGLLLDPTTWILPKKEFSGLVVSEDQQGEGKGRQPPVELQRIHPEALVHARTVREEGGQESFEAKSKVQHAVLHALLEHGVLPGLADDQVRPLHDHDGHEEGCVASPLLPIGVLQIIDSRRIPRSPFSWEDAWSEAVL